MCLGYQGSYTLNMVHLPSREVHLTLEKFWYSCDRTPPEENNVIEQVDFVDEDTALRISYSDGEAEKIILLKLKSS